LELRLEFHIFRFERHGNFSISAWHKSFVYL